MPEPVPGSVRLQQLENLPALPVEQGSHIRWNSHHVPYVIARSDRDAAFLTGIAHAHLRLGQMEILKRIATGRLSEMAGPLAYDVDVALRSLGVAQVSRESVKLLPNETKSWLHDFARGVNFFKSNAKQLPHEYSVLGIEDEPWQVEDSLALARLAGADINWFAMLGLLKAKDQDARQDFFNVLQVTAKWGSNSVVVPSGRSASGAPLVANDPHLGFTFPNFWLLSGISSPSYNVVGMSVPGVPTFAPARSGAFSWGGTNMRAWTSDFVDVTEIDKNEVGVRREHFDIRWWFNDSEDLRITPYGPIVSDLEVFDFPDGKDIALRWTGMLPSDDITPFLKLMRAPNGENVRELFKGYALPALNILYADISGNVGHILATTLPKRLTAAPQALWVSMKESDEAWSRLLGSTDLPQPATPKDGILASSNNDPIPGQSPRVGWFFSPPQRVDRIHELLSAREKIEVSDLVTLQTDVYSRQSYLFKEEFLSRVREYLPEAFSQDEVKKLQSWNGEYTESSEGATLFESVYGELYGIFKDTESEDENIVSLYQRLGLFSRRFFEKFDGLKEAQKRELLEEALSALRAESERDRRWGEVHRLRVGHLFSRIPFVGERYLLDDLAASGSRETLMKSQHSLIDAKPHSARFGSQSRHISDLSSPDANFFVLLGGQDGWIGSEHFQDQIILWNKKEYLQMPLTEEKVKELYPLVSPATN